MDNFEADIKWRDLDLRRFIGYGALFSFAIDGTLHPLELLKTRMQVQGQVSLSVTTYERAWRHLCCGTANI